MQFILIGVALFAGAQIKDLVDPITGDNEGSGASRLLIYGAAAAGAYMLWKKVK